MKTDEQAIKLLEDRLDQVTNAFNDYKAEVAKLEDQLNRALSELQKSVKINEDLKTAMKNIYIILNAHTELFKDVEEINALIEHLRNFFLNNIEVKNASN